jgi:hypothetical protein
MAISSEFRVANGTIRRSKTDKGAPYWGRLRISPAQLAALLAWSDQNTPTGYHDEPFWELEIGCWVRDGQEGEKYFSFVVEQPYKSQRVGVGEVPLAPQAAVRPAAAKAAPADGVDVDRVPF